ncbi:MAG: hypothetical protein IPF65_05675 [Polaromonas sp.]|nr:hypothetical protein [Polaromonas sp.]
MGTAFLDAHLFLDQEGRMVQKTMTCLWTMRRKYPVTLLTPQNFVFMGTANCAFKFAKVPGGAEVPYLSASYSSTFMNVDDGEMDQALTSMVRQFAQYFAQILHARDHDAFEEAHESGTLKALKALEVCVADEVLLEVSLAGVERNVSVEIARNAGRIVYRRGARSVKDKIAAQLCSFLGAKPALEDMFTRILIEGSVASIEEFLDEKQIGQLPEDGLFGNVFYSGPDTNVHAVEDEPNDDVADDVEPQAFPADESQDFVVPDEVPASIGQSDRAVKHEPRLPKDGSTPVGGTPAGKPVVDASNPYDKPEIPKPATGLEHQQHPSEGKNDSAGPKNQSVENPGIDRSFGPGRSSVDADAQKSSDKLDETTQSATGSAGDESAPDNSLAWSKTPNGGRPGFQTPFGSGASHPLGKRKSGASGKRGLEKRRTGSVAVKFFMENQAARWKSLIEMPELNPGFDVLAVAHDGEEEFIEVKGQTDIWTERGVTLTP